MHVYIYIHTVYLHIVNQLCLSQMSLFGDWASRHSLVMSDERIDPKTVEWKRWFPLTFGS